MPTIEGSMPRLTTETESAHTAVLDPAAQQTTLLRPVDIRPDRVSPPAQPSGSGALIGASLLQPATHSSRLDDMVFRLPPKFNADNLHAVRTQLEAMPVPELQHLVADDRLHSLPGDEDAVLHLRSISGLAHYQLGDRGPESERSHHFRQAWNAHVIPWRKGDAGWQVIRHTDRPQEAKTMLVSILADPHIPQLQKAISHHHFAMRQDTPLPEKVSSLFHAIALHTEPSRIARQLHELQKLDQHAVQAYIQEHLQEHT